MTKSPRVFTLQTLAPGLSLTQAILILEYPDGLLLREQSGKMSLAVYTLESLDWVFNMQKSALEPVQSLEYLGGKLGTVQKKLLPLENFLSLRNQVSVIANAP